MGRILLVVIMVFVLVTLGLGLLYNIRPLQAEEKDSLAGVMGKLEEVIRNQQAIIEKLDGIEEELKVIKVRATRN